ncbi:MAG: glucosaminidase domain-containing protein [Flavobacteriales bacterium]|nr:glucosaminidase domain-containing protein [Flavobacteriales bacterium]
MSILLRHLLLCAVALFVSAIAFSQNKARMSPSAYIQTYDQDAVREMLKSGVPASITLAQGMLESDYGNSDLAKNARNHFGIKCHSTWQGKRFYKDDDAKGECFRVYATAYESYLDHSDFLRRNKRYAFLFELKRTDYKGWARGLKKAGYATNPKYPELLIKIIEENNLQRFDTMTEEDLEDLGGIPISKEEKLSTNSPRSTSKPSTYNGTVVVSNNNIKYVQAGAGDNADALAKRHNMGRWQILRYNEIDKTYRFSEGEVVYLQPKRRKFRGAVNTHLVKSGETLWSISQEYGIRKKRLARMNGLSPDMTISAGQSLNLR